MIKLLFQSMLLRRYLKETIAPIFIDAIERITDLNKNSTNDDSVAASLLPTESKMSLDFSDDDDYDDSDDDISGKKKF